MANAFFVRCDCRNRRFTGGGRSRFVQREADGRKGIASAADELCGSALMMEQPHMRKAHDHIIQITGCNDVIIPDRPAGLGLVLHAAAVRTLDIVAEREERVAAQRHIRVTSPATLAFLPAVSGSGFTLKNRCQRPSASTSSASSEIYTSMVLSRSARRDLVLKGQGQAPSRAGAATSCRPCCPARRVQ